MLSRTATPSLKIWTLIFVFSFLLVGIYVCYSISLRPYPNDSMRLTDMITCFFYGGFLGGWLGVLGVWFTQASWNCLFDLCATNQKTVTIK